MKLSLIAALMAAVGAAGGAGAQEERDMQDGDRVAWTTRVTDYGAVGDGVTDDTQAFQQALDGAAAQGGVCFVPPGQYLIGGALDVPESVALTGVWQAPHFTDLERGTTLLATGGKGSEDGPPFIMLHRSSAVRGLTIYYPEQDAADIQPYPWCIQGEDTHCSVIDVTLVNPYKGIDFGTYPNEMHYVENVYGQPLRLGIFIDKCTDIGRVQNVHFNPNPWTRTGAVKDIPALFQYLEDNLVGFLIGKTDWEYMRDCFVIFPKIGFHFIETERGFPNVVLTQCGADITPLAVQVDGVQPHSGVSFSNSQMMGTVVIGPQNRGPVKFTSCGFWPIAKTNEQAIVQGRGTVTFSACHFSGWANEDPEAPCVRVDNGGVAIITGTDFMAPHKNQIHIGENAGGVILTNSRLRGGAKITNQAQDAEVIIKDNLNR